MSSFIDCVHKQLLLDVKYIIFNAWLLELFYLIHVYLKDFWIMLLKNFIYWKKLFGLVMSLFWKALRKNHWRHQMYSKIIIIKPVTKPRDCQLQLLSCASHLLLTLVKEKKALVRGCWSCCGPWQSTTGLPEAQAPKCQFALQTFLSASLIQLCDQTRQHKSLFPSVKKCCYSCWSLTYRDFFPVPHPPTDTAVLQHFWHLKKQAIS